MTLSEVVARVNPGRAPARTYLVGQSLGGRAVLLGIRFFPERFAGALAMCAVGQETNDVRAAHCQFSEQEQVQAFDDLVTWVRTAKRPDGDDVMADLRDAGRRFTNPLRPGDPGTLRIVP